MEQSHGCTEKNITTDDVLYLAVKQQRFIQPAAIIVISS